MAIDILRRYLPLDPVFLLLGEKAFTKFREDATIISEKERKGGVCLIVRIETAEREEIVIRCRAPSESIYALKAAIEETMRKENTITLMSDGASYFVPKSEILFFESSEGKVYAHTKDAMYTAPYKLFELEERMPPSFVRVSKSVIANLLQIRSLKREVVGNGELTFRGCDKKAYFSRAYYKLLQYKLEEMRLKT